MAVRWDTVTVDGKPVRVYMGVPEGNERRAGVLVAQHGPGVDDFVKDAVIRLFREGYVAAAPELFHRQPAQVPEGTSRVTLLKDDEIIADMNATLVHMKGLKEVSVGPVGIVGFCMGGRLVYLMSAASKDLKAGVMFYGSSTMEPYGDAGPTPFDRTREISCPIQGHFGADDQNPSPDDMRKLDAELTKFGKPHEFHSYAGAAHAFVNSGSRNYRPHAASLSWPKAMEFFARHLVA